MISSRIGMKVYSARSKDLMLAFYQVVAEVSHTQVSEYERRQAYQEPQVFLSLTNQRRAAGLTRYICR